MNEVAVTTRRRNQGSSGGGMASKNINFLRIDMIHLVELFVKCF